MKKIVLASNNAGKIRELNNLLSPLNCLVVSQSELNVPEIEETGLCFVENSILKARNASKYTGLSAIADDSGLEVNFLKGAPGIYSARYAGANASDSENNSKLLQELKGLEQANRTARFRCCIVYMAHDKDPSPIIAEGTWDGYISSKEKGDSGFGYDPLFYIPELSCNSAELSPEKKNRISHRAKASKQLLSRLKHEL